MIRAALLELCFGRSDFEPGDLAVVEASSGDSLLGHVDVYRRKVPFEHGVVDVAAIGQVCVDPAFRGQAVATGLLTTAHGIARAVGLRWAACYAGLPRLYEPLGYFHPAGAPRHFIVAPLAGQRDSEWPAARQLDTEPW